MREGYDPVGDSQDSGILFDPCKERSGQVVEKTPPPVSPGSGRMEPPSSGKGVDRTIVTSTPTPIPEPVSRSTSRGGSGETTGNLSTDNPLGSDLQIGADGSAMLQAGQVLFDRFVVERKLGEGGMGSVWLVRHLVLNSERALKLIVSGIARDEQARARFLREARIMELLNHPNAVRVHDVRVGNDVAFIEMEYVRGKSLNQVLKPGVAMPVDWVADLLDQLCDVLQAANDQHIIHRDLKPPNLMLVEGRLPGTKVLKLLDFGIAKIREGGVDDLHTQAGAFLGTPLYSSPEQITGGEVDSRSDLYSVGLILYEMLTGYRPFSGPMSSLVYKQTMALPPPFLEVNPAFRAPAAIEAVVMKCLAKKPEDRPQSPRELVAMFHQALGSSSYTAAPPTYSAHSKTEAYYPDGVAPPSGIVSGVGTTPQTIEYQAFTPPPAPTAGSAFVPGPMSGVAFTPAPMSATFAPAPTVGPAKAVRTSSLRSRLVHAFGFGAFALAALIVGLLFIKPMVETNLRIRAWVEVQARRGFMVDEPGWIDRRWPKLLVTTGGNVRFVRNPSGIYLPEGYEPGKELAEDGYPRMLTRRQDGTVFVRIVGGTFSMGGLDSAVALASSVNRPVHPVQLSGFYMQQTEVTNGEIVRHVAELGGPGACEEWEKIYHKLAQHFLLNDDAKARRHPAVGISWRIAKLYAEKRGGRLPTEAQWEYAARSEGRDYLYVWDYKKEQLTSELITRLANISTIGNTSSGTTAVGSYPTDASQQGVLDLTGNVREWCRDAWRRYEYSSRPVVDPEFAPSPTAMESGEVKMVVRGGSYLTGTEYGQTTNRDEPSPPDWVTSDVGFRIIIECPEIPRDAL